MSIGPGRPPGETASLADVTDQLRKAGIDTSALERDILEAGAAVQLASQRSVRAPLAATSAAIAAATRGCFLPSDLATSSDPVPAEDIDTLLAHSDVITTGLQRAWRLRPDARRDILLQASAQGRLGAIIADQLEPLDERDGEGPLLRRVLAGEAPNVARLSMEALGQLQIVSEWLGKTSLAKVPEPEALRRAIGQREILDPFRMLVGRSVEAGSDGSHDRVVGRVDEMERLRAYVGVREPEELKYYARRAMSSLWSTVTFSDDASEPLLIKGIGGMGKSTLIAKFVLDHALIPNIDLPFVYLDFDRAALAPRQPLQLLLEVATQLGIQFPNMEPGLAELRRHLRSSIDLHAKNAERREAERHTRSELTSFCASLRTAVEAANPHRAPVVILFDTFEVVQYDQAAVEGVNALITSLRRPAQRPWENLRIIVAGRGDLSDVKTSKQPVELLQLSIDATEELIKRRSESERLGLTTPQIKVLAPPLSNSPLDVIVVTNWLRDRKPDERASLVEDLVKDIGSGDTPRRGNAPQRGSRELATRRITGILIRRMIGHINDPEVRDLADPGLIVRAVTPEIIREVMAPASGLSSEARPLPAGAELELWKRLARERWLVNLQGNVLMHRPEVRRAMLDLMRERDKADFDRTNTLAIATFRKRPAHDDAARSEAVYHLLLSRDARLEEVEALWSPFVGSSVSTSIDDLAPLQKGYVEAKLGRSVRIETLESFPRAVLLPLVVANGPRYLQDLGPASFLRLLDSAQARVNPACSGLMCEALYRAGRWSGLIEISRGKDPSGRVTEAIEALWQGDSRRLETFDEPTLTALRFLLRWATRDGFADLAWKDQIDRFVREVTDASGPLRVPALCWDFATFVACDGSRRRLIRSRQREAILNEIGERCRRHETLPSEAAGSDALRVLSFFERGSDRPILRRVDFDSHFATVSGREIRAFEAMMSAASEKSSEVPRKPREFASAVRRGRELLASASSYSERTVRADVEFKREFASVARTVADTGNEVTSHSVVRILSLKHPDWSQPLGNALTEAFGGKVSRKLGWWSSIDKYLGSGEQPRSERETTDGREILSLADEAASLPEAVDAYAKLLKDSNRSGAEDFLRLAEVFAEWVKTIDHMAGDVGTETK